VTTVYRFGNFELQPEQRRLLRDDYAVTLGGRAFDMLVALAGRAGQLVTKSELLELVWPGLIVEENNLQVQISTLRKVLGPQLIVTVPGRGYRLMIAPNDATAPAGCSASAFAASLQDAPAGSSGLYGRADDIAAVSELIRHHALVTVVGPAGIGKTRLAQAVADELRAEFADGTWLVELAPLADPLLVVDTIARALGLAAGDARNALELTVQALAEKRLLLVVDNCEHLLDAVVQVVAALQKGAASVRVLVTSQEVLRQADEHVYRLGPLGLPAAVNAALASESGAVQLFVARLQAAQPLFRITDENVPGVVEICRRLDGIPLAIELAAARVPLLGVEQVRERLNERFRLLTAGSRLALPRHQTLRAALDWSYSLLSVAEQAVFDKLGVFAGSFSLESAQKLATDDAMDEWAVLDHLGALVDKSLVSVDGGGTARYRMLETTRAFALERLAVGGATAATMRRHGEVMLDFFEGFYRDILHGKPPAKGAKQRAADLDNLRGALHWASETGGDRRIAIALLGAAGAARGYLHYVAPVEEAWQWCEVLSPLLDESISAADAARFWLTCAELSGHLSPAKSVEYAKRAIALYRDLGDRLGTYLGCNELAYSLMETGQLDEAKQVLGEALDLRDPAWPPWLRGLIDNMGALIFGELGALGEARGHALEYLAISRQIDSPVDEWTALSILVDLDVAAGNVPEAEAAAREMLARQRATPEMAFDGLGLRDVAAALMNANRLDEADTVYREALSLVRRNYGTGAKILYDAAMLLARRGRSEDAARVWAYSAAYYAAKGIPPRLVARQIRDRLHALLATEISADKLARLYEEGRRLTDDEACSLAFPPVNEHMQD
jgi:predicted ATPase/DNA-binding winged helix-turn-helix (wHTH) protein